MAVEDGASSQLTYQDLTAYLVGPKTGVFTAVTICLCEICFCSGFVIVILENFQHAEPGVSREAIAIVLAPVLVMLGQIKWLPELCVFSFMGAVIYGVGVIGCSIGEAELAATILTRRFSGA